MVFRPANSPELKDLELAPFASKQSLQYNTPCNGVDELVFVVEEAFKLMRAETLNGIFISKRRKYMHTMSCTTLLL